MPSSAVASTSSRRPGQRGSRARARQDLGLLVGRGRVEAHGAERLGVRRAHRVDVAAVGRDLHVGVGERVVGQPGELAARDVEPEHRRPAVLVGGEHERGPVGRPLQRARGPVVPVAGEVAHGPVGDRVDGDPAVTRVVRRRALLRHERDRLAVRAEARAVVLALDVVEHAPAGRRSRRRSGPGRSAGRPARAAPHVVATVEPSGLTAYIPSTRALPGSGVRSVRSSFGSSPSAAGSPSVPAKSRGAPGPRSWSQNRTGTRSCRIAETFFSLRSLRFAASASSVSEPGNVRAGEHDGAGLGGDLDVVDATRRGRPRPVPRRHRPAAARAARPRRRPRRRRGPGGRR